MAVSDVIYPSHICIYCDRLRFFVLTKYVLIRNNPTHKNCRECRIYVDWPLYLDLWILPMYDRRTQRTLILILELLNHIRVSDRLFFVKTCWKAQCYFPFRTGGVWSTQKSSRGFWKQLLLSRSWVKSIRRESYLHIPLKPHSVKTCLEH